jgi:hypothetical protein
MSIRPGLILAIVLALLAMASPALADRELVVNGQVLSNEQAVRLDSMSCTLVPDGRYWVAPNGAWGYEGNPYRMGFVGEQCGRAEASQRKSLSERGLLYYPGELLR